MLKRVGDAERTWIATPERSPWFTCVLRGPELEYCYVNDAHRSSFGSRDFVGNSAFVVMPEIIGQPFFRDLHYVLDTGRTLTGDSPIFLNENNDGELVNRHIEYSYTAVHDSRGHVNEIVVEGRLREIENPICLSPVEQAAKFGVKGLTDKDLLTLMLPGGEAQSEELLTRFKSLRKVFSVASHGLRSKAFLERIGAKPLGSEVVLRLQVARELHRRVLLERVVDRPILSSTSSVKAYLRETLSDEPIEQFRVIFLDAALRIIADEQMNKGSVVGCAVYTREVLRLAIEFSALSLILVHNHPARTTKFSPADISITRELVSAAATLDITVFDHLLVAGDSVVSLRQQQRWP